MYMYMYIERHLLCVYTCTLSQCLLRGTISCVCGARPVDSLHKLLHMLAEMTGNHSTIP